MTQSGSYEIDEIIIDEEFGFLLPALDKETYAMLEGSLLEHGCLHPLILWENVLIDGHNRYEIALKHGIPVTTVSMDFSSREDATIWIITTQMARRNLNHFQLSYYRGKHYLADRLIQGSNNQFAQESEKRHNVVFQGSTAKRLADQYNVSSRTIDRDVKVAEAISAIGMSSPQAKRDILNGKVNISKKHLRELLAGSQEDIADTAVKIENGTLDSLKPRKPLDDGSALDDSALIDVQPLFPLEREYKRAADDFYSILQGLLSKGDTASVKSAFRSHIDLLEVMYEGI